MRTGADQKADAILDARLDRGAADIVQLRRALAEGAGPWFRPEGVLHAYLLARIRRGEIVHSEPQADGRVRYARSADALPQAAATRDDPPPLAPARSKAALRVAKGVRDPADRGRVLADVLAHMEAIDAPGGEGGKSFGSLGSAAQALRRADKGKRVFAFRDGFGDTARAFLFREGPWILSALVLFLILKFFIADVFWIPSSSMRPTLEENDRVVVFLLGADKPPARFSVTTFERGDRTFVKRLIAFGGELVSIFRGDVIVNGEILVKPEELRDALRFPRWSWTFEGAGHHRDWVTAAGEHPLPRRTLAGDIQESLWSDIWYEGRRGPMQRERRVHVHDGYLTLDAERPTDGVVELSLLRRAPVAETALGSFEQHPLTARLQVGPEGTVLTLQIGESAERVLRREAPPPAGATRLELSIIDGVLRAAAPGLEIEHGLAGDGLSTLLPLVPQLAVAGGASLRGLSLDQDIHYGYGYTDRALPANWVHGVPTARDLLEGDPRTWAWRVPEGSVYMLGDNTNDSSDSRVQNVGAIPVEDLIAPVAFRIWPPSRIGAID